MSQASGVGSTWSGGSPGSLKRKRNSPSQPLSGAFPSEAAKSAKLANGAPAHADPRAQAAFNGAGAAKQYRSPDSDEARNSDNGDTLRGIGSASSLTSTASSVFSHNSQAFAQNRKASLANGLTPLTSHTESSSPKGNSPRLQKSTSDMAASNGAYATSHPTASDITPEPSHPRRDRPQMLPPPGTAKGYRVVWDPELDGKLSREERKRATPRRREFGTEVRHIFHNLLSLRKMMIHMT